MDFGKVAADEFFGFGIVALARIVLIFVAEIGCAGSGPGPKWAGRLSG